MDSAGELVGQRRRMGAVSLLLTCGPLIKMFILVNLLEEGHVVEMPVKQGFGRQGDQDLLKFFACAHSIQLVPELRLGNASLRLWVVGGSRSGASKTFVPKLELGNE